MVGPEHVMGLAIGNELELLHNHVTRHAAQADSMLMIYWCSDLR